MSARSSIDPNSTSEGMRPHPPSSLFQQHIDPLSGQTQWVLVREDEAAQSDQSRLAHTSYLDMLNDVERNRAFEAAINRALHSSPGLLVLDIGAGTGLLSMMAARALQKAGAPGEVPSVRKLVIACEAFLPMYVLAKKILHINGYSSSVHLVHKRSEDMEVGKDMISRADVLVTEILDSMLLGEGIIPTLQHAHDHLLKSSALVIPHKAIIFGQLVQCDHLWRMHDLQGVETQVGDGVGFHPNGLNQRSLLKPWQYAMHVDALIDKIELMSQPFQVFELDFSIRPSSQGKRDFLVKARRTGVVHAIISWWVLQLDEEGLEFYSTAPKWIEQLRTSWHDHWKQCVWFAPGGGLHVIEGEDIRVSFLHDEISFIYDLTSTSVPSAFYDGSIINNPWEISMRPERVGLLGSSKWRSIVMNVVKKAFHGISSSVCLVVDDSLPLAILAASASAMGSVVSLFPGLRNIDSRVVHGVLEVHGLDSGRLKVITKMATELTVGDIGSKKVDLLIGEPYYMACEDMLPWWNLRFWKEKTALTKLLSENAMILPCQGILYGMAMSMHDLWSSRRALQSVQGFNHSPANKVLGACGDLPTPLEGPILPYYLWQSGDNQELTEPFSVMTFDFSKAIETVKSSKKVEILRSGICHGIVFWIDWVMHPDGEERVYTGPRGHEPTYWKQGVKLLRLPVQVSGLVESASVASVFDLHATFDAQNGELFVDVEFL